jgi:hypothetical protein
MVLFSSGSQRITSAFSAVIAVIGKTLYMMGTLEMLEPDASEEK